jgi:hypothetical protein
LSVNETEELVHRSRIPRLLGEMVVVVASILLAFAIDAWWDDRGDRKAENMLLERLQADFSEIKMMLEVARKDHTETHDACVALLEFAVGEPLPVSAEVDTMVARVFIASRTFNPGSGAVAAFLNSDRARLVGNQPLADLLLAWSGLVEELQEEEVQLAKGVSERWTPYLASRTSLGPYIATYGDLMSGLPGKVAQPSQRIPLVVDEEFVNHVLNRFTWQQLALREIGPLSAAIDEILALLEQELQT